MLQGKCIQAVAHLSTVPENRYTVVAEGGLQILMDVVKLNHSDITHKDRLALTRIIANVCQEETLVQFVIDQGWLWYMVDWSRCGILDLEGEAYRALSNIHHGAERHFLHTRQPTTGNPGLLPYYFGIEGAETLASGAEKLAVVKDKLMKTATETAVQASERFPMLGAAYDRLQESKANGYGLFSMMATSASAPVEKRYSRNDWKYDDGVYVIQTHDGAHTHAPVFTHSRVNKREPARGIPGLNSLMDAQSLNTDTEDEDIEPMPSNEFDIVFLHGLLGGAFFTWRQQPSSIFHGDLDHAPGETLSWPR
ncbi:hypothetical protein SARC_07519 [Sphaeroforma arctica JP610]|uniref:Uncharacterized protein n=1 Tax=Sphaeroforma arctica JP610 TaxID=667725 RepID=A0A0L0FU86_9EUKA|nr:hypothetical protein SARC_07519 [Sphaeroforma arctica JP610]KNC80106.1 hypothetical protein SARC_07519 [Sphaeroforma arctica JP610]|eukprot:XP_014154008.1 hypothetical protein SARC_07519 [Sphaeroforma arctica JP610]